MTKSIQVYFFFLFIIIISGIVRVHLNVVPLGDGKMLRLLKDHVSMQVPQHIYEYNGYTVS